MNPKTRNILAVVLGWIIGSMINMMLVKIGHTVYPIPGVNMENFKEIAQIMPTLEAKYFLFPYLAHALGTLFGAFAATLFGKTNKLLLALIIGGLFFIGGIMVNILVSGPIWFTIADLISYFPMACLGYLLATLISKK
jgi:hypothetical protein